MVQEEENTLGKCCYRHIIHCLGGNTNFVVCYSLYWVSYTGSFIAVVDVYYETHDAIVKLLGSEIMLCSLPL